MTSSGDAAEEVVRMMLTGTEVMLRLTASATKNMMAMSLALAQNHKKLSGRTNMKKMLRETRDIRVFPMTRAQFKQFEKKAKKYKLLYASIRDIEGKTKLMDVVLPATELDRANLVFQKIRYSETKEDTTTETKAAKAEEPKNASRSRNDCPNTRNEPHTSKEGPSRNPMTKTEERTSVEVRLQSYSTQLEQQRASAKQRTRKKIQRKRGEHKKHR